MSANRRRPRGLHRNPFTPHDGFLAWANSPPVTGALCMLAALLCLTGGLLTHRHASALRERGIQAQADVLRAGDDRSVLLRFTTAQGQEITAEVGALDWNPAPVAGDTAKVIYDPIDPGHSVTNAYSTPNPLVTWLLCGLALLFGVLAPLSFTGRVRWRTLHH
ncbi:DUF3592 domain-containing protein [Catenuloplanes atrovinosus]|uniref:DUF3592 domain-containing protein n=1 Tax=Catenuloplanes atrovinosus TaxID=137266 RepID=A0AAE3YJD5_9ACTN|nr:DUF3592 domain-containing protein [Catenuloplanes atrovinosus]MDR7273557.1 hypothetical protein [Catenuloplanes atrovinosus]